MTCPEAHDWRAVLAYVVPDPYGDGDVRIVGGPPQSDDDPAWCRLCGSLRAEAPLLFGFGGGMGTQHPMVDMDAPTLGNMIRQNREEEKGAGDPLPGGYGERGAEIVRLRAELETEKQTILRAAVYLDELVLLDNVSRDTVNAGYIVLGKLGHGPLADHQEGE